MAYEGVVLQRCSRCVVEGAIFVEDGNDGFKAGFLSKGVIGVRSAKAHAMECHGTW